MAPRAGASSPLPDWLRCRGDSLTITVLARPKASRTGVIGVDRRGLVIGLNSPPERGRAKDELIATIAALAGVARSRVSVARGASGRSKVVRIAAHDPGRVAAAINAAVNLR
jgi:hypothetical protein